MGLKHDVYDRVLEYCQSLSFLTSVTQHKLQHHVNEVKWQLSHHEFPKVAAFYISIKQNQGFSTTRVNELLCNFVFLFC